MVSISAPPEGDPDAEQKFSLCDSIPCACSCYDPFDPRTVVDTGIYAGLCLNTCYSRNVLLLSEKKTADLGYFKHSRLKDNKIVYAANIFHLDTNDENPEFHVGKIDPAGIKDVILQIEYAGGVQAHAQMRFTFHAEKPVILVPQDTSHSRMEISVTNLYYSAEALGPPGVPYKGDYGFRRQYFQRHRLTTQLVRAKRMIQELNHRVWQFRLEITSEQKAGMLLKTLRNATDADPQERYHTTQNNCVLALFKVIDDEITLPWYRKFLVRITDNTLFMPTRAPKHLGYRGIAGTKKVRFRLPNLETELGWEKFINISLYEK